MKVCRLIVLNCLGLCNQRGCNRCSFYEEEEKVMKIKKERDDIRRQTDREYRHIV
jgi:hypothetical protein